MRKLGRVSVILLFALVAAAAARADVKLPALFGDNAVLQRGVQVPVWGWADDGEKVVVSIQGKPASAVAKDGKWKLALPPLAPGGPFEMTVVGKNTIVLKNILVGEVWVASGQSNMNFTLSRAAAGPEAIAGSADDQLRFFKVRVTAADEPADDVKAQWTIAGPKTSPGITAVGYYFARDLRKQLGVPVGLIHSALGGTNAYSWMNRATLESDPDFANILQMYAKSIQDWPKKKPVYEKKAREWREAIAAKKKAGEKVTRDDYRKRPRMPMGPENVKRPCGLYYAMIKPLQPYAIAGAIWYQGESNAGSEANSIQYRKLFPAMIADWRKDWGQGDFPFYFVQLAAYGKKDEPWALLREAQTMTLDASPNTGMAVTIDVGNETDIHPTDKKTVGERLALIALARTYGKDIPYSGPIYKSMEAKGGKAILSFDHADGGLKAKGDSLVGFEIAGADGKFVPAQARIDGDKVVVSAEGVADPKAVHYGWKAYTECNLYNGASLPASPFRTNPE